MYGSVVYGLKDKTYPVHFSSQITSCGQVFEPKQAVPVPCTASTRIIVNHLVEE